MKGRINATNLEHLRGEIYNVHVVHKKTRHEYRIIDAIPLKVGGNDDWTLAIVYSPCDDGRIKAFCRDWKNFFDSFSIVACNRKREKGSSSSGLSEWCRDVFLNIIDTCFIGEEDPVPLLRHNGKIIAAIEHHTFEDGFECAVDVNGIIWFKYPGQAFQRPCAKLCYDMIKKRDPDLAEEMLGRSTSIQKSGNMGQPSNPGE
jgi:hypothetical protein